jgi:hypothetical protein
LSLWFSLLGKMFPNSETSDGYKDIKEWTSKRIYLLCTIPCQAAVSGARDLRECICFWDLRSLFLFLHHWRCAKNCYRSLRTGGHSSSLFFCCGESPRRCRVYDSVCARHGKRLPLRRQFERHVRCPLTLSSEMLNVAGALQSKHSVIYAMI